MEYRLFFLVCLYITVSAFSCGDDGIEYDATIKYRVSGSVSDQNGNPLESMTINLIEFGQSYRPIELGSKCTQTDLDGRFDFVVSDANGIGSVLTVNSIVEQRPYVLSCVGEFRDEYETQQFFYNDESYIDYEVNFDVVLQPSVPVSIVSSNKDRTYYRVTHSGVSVLDSVNEFYWNELNGLLDKATLCVRPNQNLEIFYSNDYLGIIRDTIVELGNEALLIQLDSI